MKLQSPNNIHYKVLFSNVIDIELENINKNVNSFFNSNELRKTEIMAHSLTPPPPATVTTPISGKISNYVGLPRVKVFACHQCQVSDQRVLTGRRTITLTAGAVLGLSLREESASAAGRRPPPPPAEEKKDPNVSGVQAKVLASKRRKEAMKDAMAKMRQKGKPVQQKKSEPEPTPPPPAPE